MANRVIEVNEEGAVYLPADLLDHAPPHSRFVVSVRGGAIVLQPVASPPPFWTTASPQERAEDLLNWATGNPDGPGLPDEALRREHLYD